MPVETTGRGAPRVQYKRTYVLLPPSATRDVAKVVLDAAWDQDRWTIGGSADDAGIGDLDVRRVIALNPSLWPGDLAEFFAGHYGGVAYWALPYSNVFQCEGRLLAYSLKAARLPLFYPVRQGTERDPYVTGDFGVWRGTFYHNGLDLRASWAVWGDMVVSATDGMVVRAGYNSDEKWFGYQVRIRTNTPDGREVLVRYAHMVASSICVEVGDTVVVGQALGKPDSTGESTADHLHIDVKVADAPQTPYADPELLMDWALPDPTPTTVRGVHAAPIPSPPTDWQYWLDELKAMGIAWYKALATGGQDMLNWLTMLVEHDITPIVRLYQGSQFPHRLNAQLIDYADELIAAGIVHFEVGNEPNLDCEWNSAYRARVDWHNTELVEQVAETWYQDAMEIVAAGGKPAFYAMAPTDRGGVNQRYSGPMWATGMVEYLANHYPGLGGLLADGTVWVATHTSPFNRSLDYNPLAAGNWDDMCMRGHEYYTGLFQSFFGVKPTTISTEGGAYSPEHLEYLGWGTYTEEHWAQLVLDVFEYTQSSQLTAMCPWILTDENVGDARWHDNGWYRGRSPRLPVQVLKSTT